jgi:hypothetical protein
MTQSGHRSVDSRPLREIDVDSDRINRWLTLGANIAVLFGIFFLAAEISQNTDMMRTQINQSRAELSMNEAQAMYNSQYLPEILTKLRRGEAITEVDRERYNHFLRGLHRNLDNQLRQYREGYLADNIPRSVRAALMAEVVPIDVARELWQRTKGSFSDEYVAFVDGILSENSE